MKLGGGVGRISEWKWYDFVVDQDCFVDFQLMFMILCC